MSQRINPSRHAQVLWHMMAHGPEPVKQSAIAEDIGISRQRVSHVMQDLLAMGLIRRTKPGPRAKFAIVNPRKGMRHDA